MVQELVIHSDNTRYLRARYDLPAGGSVLAPFPAGVLPVEGGRFGANLVAYILDQYHQAQVTEPLVKLVPHNDQHRAALDQVRGQIWELYPALQAYRAQPAAAPRPVLEARFDALVDQRTGYPSIDPVLKEMRDHRADLLRVLERPDVPLHNNAMESDIREFVQRRKISGGTRSDAGRRCRDTFASLKKTCRTLGLRFWDYLQDRVRGLGKIPRLAEWIRQRAAEAAATKATAAPV